MTADELAAAVRGHRPRVTQVLRAVGLLGTPPPIRDLELVLARGRAVHRACELQDKRELDASSVHPMVAPFLEAFVRFKREKHVTRGLVWERRLHHPQYGYTGRIDTLLLLDAEVALVDLKSGSDDLATVHQLALYDELVRIQTPPIVPPVSRWGALVLKDDGRYVWKEHTAAEIGIALQDALAAVRVHHALARMGRLPELPGDYNDEEEVDAL